MQKPWYHPYRTEQEFDRAYENHFFPEFTVDTLCPLCDRYLDEHIEVSEGEEYRHECPREEI